MSDPIMVDCETLSLKPNALILSIGAVRFGAGLSRRPEQAFYVGVSVADQERYGRHACYDTLKWWMDQPEDVRIEAFSGTTPLAVAMAKFAEWVGADKPDLWVKGYKDIVWIETAFEDCGMPLPFNFRRIFDLRTLQELSGVPGVEASGLKKHHALDDATNQALIAQSGLNEIITWRNRHDRKVA